MNRAYAVLHVKAVDAERRELTGVATTPEPDRIGDVIEPLGAKFKNPLPLLLFHDHTQPVGSVKFDKPTDEGITFTAKIPSIDEPGSLKTRVDEAWQMAKLGLVRGVSIGFRVLDDGIELLRSGGIRFTKIEILELSLVSVPANAAATIASIKSLDAEHLAATGTEGSRPVQRSGVSDITTRVVRLAERNAMKTIAERKQAFVAEKEAKVQKMNALMPEDGGATLDAAQQEEFDTLDGEIKSIDGHLARLETLERVNVTKAVPVAGGTPDAAAAARSGAAPVITVKQNLPPGIGFARLAMVKACAHMDHRYVNDVAKEMYPHDDRLQAYLQQKATVAAGTTTNAVWASALIDQTNLVSEFVEFLTPMTIIGKFGTNGIPSPTRVPFNIRVPRQTALGEAYWVGEGAPKPVGADEFDAITMLYTKVATIRVITQELARFSTPSAETLVRDGLVKAVARRLDIDFIDPAQAAVANVNPASITNGVTPLSSAGTSADNVRTDLANLIETFLVANVDPTSLVLIMPNTLALAISLLVNSLGQQEFPGMTMRGGALNGIPVIASQYAANASGSGNLVIALNASELLLADDGRVDIDISTEASLQMLDNPTNNSASGTATTMVSLWQTNSIGLRAERFINWVKARSTAVAFMDDVNWGSIGSPS